MKETYKGYEITYQDYGRKFCARIGDSSYENADLEKVRKHIDNLDKKSFARTPVLVEDGWGSGIVYKPATVTSEATNENFRGIEEVEVWVVDIKGRRSKHSTKTLVLDTHDNKETIGRIDMIKREMKRLQAVMEEEICSLTRYTPNTKVKNEPAS